MGVNLTYFYNALKGTWPAAGRDGYSLSWKNVMQDGSIMLVSWDYQDNIKCPENPNYVRMKVHLGALQFIPTSHNKSTIK